MNTEDLRDVEIAAILARKSNDQPGVVDAERSVAHQVEQARAYAARHGWVVDDRYVFIDDGISGAEFVKRPGLIRLLGVLTPRAPFRHLIMSEESRLGREQIETSYILKRILDADVRVHYYLDDRERTLDSPMDKMMAGLQHFAAPKWSASAPANAPTAPWRARRGRAMSPAAGSTATTTSMCLRRIPPPTVGRSDCS